MTNGVTALSASGARHVAMISKSCVCVRVHTSTMSEPFDMMLELKTCSKANPVKPGAIQYMSPTTSGGFCQLERKTHNVSQQQPQGSNSKQMTIIHLLQSCTMTESHASSKMYRSHALSQCCSSTQFTLTLCPLQAFAVTCSQLVCAFKGSCPLVIMADKIIMHQLHILCTFMTSFVRQKHSCVSTQALRVLPHLNNTLCRYAQVTHHV